MYSSMFTPIYNTLSKLKLWMMGGYNAEKYWSERHNRYGLDLRGVGNKSISKEKNEREYSEAKEIILSICIQNKINFDTISVLDVGCGNGFYANLMQEMGCVNYRGIDITDTLFPELKERFPKYHFRKLDITKNRLSRSYDLILMIDVTQHITSEKHFRYALKNVKEHMKENSLFIVTSWLDKNIRNSFYEKSRTLKSYKQIFQSNLFSKQIKFRDKYVFFIFG